MIFNEVLELVKKNFKTLIRAKTGSLIVILGPLLIIFLAGLAFDNTGHYAVKVGAYRPEVDDITSEFLDTLRTEFQIYEYDSQEKCVNSIKQGDINTCIVFPDQFVIGEPTKNELKFYVDYSRVNLVWTIMNVMTEQVSEERLRVSKDLTKTLLDTLEYTKQRIHDQRSNLVKLTTENELINRNTQDLIAELGDVDLQFDQDAPIDDLASANTQIKQWSDNALDLGKKAVSRAKSYIGNAESLVRSSGMAAEAKQKLADNLADKLEDLSEIEADMSKTGEVTLSSFEMFNERLEAVTNGIQNTKSKLNAAETSRELSLRILEALQELLDQSLINVLSVQQSFDDISNKIDAIAIKDPESITQPIVTTIKPIVQEKTYLNYLFPVLIVLVIMFTGLLITPTLILLEKHSAASFRAYMTPVKNISYLLATFITSSLILLLQVLLILAIASVFFTGHVLSNIPQAFFLLILINSIFILLGMMIGYIFNTEETVTLAAVTLGAICLFISDVIIPLESMPQTFAYIASFNPYVLGSSLLRRILLFDASLLSMLNDILLLGGYILAGALLASGLYIYTKGGSLEKTIKKFAPVFFFKRRHQKKRK